MNPCDRHEKEDVDRNGSGFDCVYCKVEQLEAALKEIASAANYTAPEDIEARLHNETKVYAIATAALEDKDE